MPALHRYFGTPVTTCDSEHPLLHALLRHPLRHAGHHPRRPGAHGSRIAILGIRLGNGAEGGLPGAEDRRSARAFPEGSRRPRQPHEAQRMAGALARRLDQSCAPCCCSARISFCCVPGLALLALGLLLTVPVSLGPRAARSHHALAQLDDAGPDPLRGRAAVLLPGLHRAGDVPLLRGAGRTLAAPVFVTTAPCWPAASPGWRAARSACRWSINTWPEACACRRAHAANASGGAGAALPGRRLPHLQLHAGAARRQPPRRRRPRLPGAMTRGPISHALVTGGAGCIGSDLAAALLDRGHRVTVIDNLSSGKHRAHRGPAAAPRLPLHRRRPAGPRRAGRGPARASDMVLSPGRQSRRQVRSRRPHR